MDIATAAGLLGGFGVIFTLIMLDGGHFAHYWSDHALIVIFGGATMATMTRFPFSAIAHGLPIGIKFAFGGRAMHPRDLIAELTKIADLMRKGGPMALESIEIPHPFMAQGIRYLVDGYDKEFIRTTMETDRDIFLQRLDEGSKVYRAYGDCAPAWGMIGTILGMVTMFANMSDPSKLGPAMATALLATLYGALIANMICLPLADKLHVKKEEEDVSRTLIIDGVLLLRDAKSPSLIREMLVAYLPEHARAELVEAA